MSKQYSWKERIADAYLTVPKTLKEFAWKVGLASMAISSAFAGLVIWKHPNVLTGTDIDKQSPIERFMADKSLKSKTAKLMEDYFYNHRPYGLMFVSWEEVDSMAGLWVRPADKFPGKSGPHDLSPDMRDLGGPFLFGECAQTTSLAMPDKIMVACPIINSYHAWGYVAAIVEDDQFQVADTVRLLDTLAHRLTELIY